MGGKFKLKQHSGSKQLFLSSATKFAYSAPASMGGINKEKEKEKSCSNSHNKGQQNTSGDFCDGLSIVGWYIQMNNKIVDAQFFPL